MTQLPISILHLPFVSFPFAPFLSIALSIPPSYSPPQIQLRSLWERCMLRQQVSGRIRILTHSRGLRTHLVAASFSFPEYFLWRRKMRHSPYV